MFMYVFLSEKGNSIEKYVFSKKIEYELNNADFLFHTDTLCIC